ncbi:MAG: lysine--tRNA ligase, partial [Muribaculaceae bacterium]|nr:lysine--tRNA ligase [Muribaculaceae bacterium]
MNVLELSEQEIVRRNSLAALRQMGINPYPADEYVVTGHADEIRETFADDAPQREVAVAGRIMSRRIMGKASFMELKDSHSRIQVYISRDDLCPNENQDLYNVVFKKLLDIG